MIVLKDVGAKRFVNMLGVDTEYKQQGSRRFIER